MIRAIRPALALAAGIFTMPVQSAVGQLKDWPWLGVVITDISSGNVHGYTGGGSGSYITGVEEPGPAATAGLYRHDIIVGLDGRTALNTRELTCLLQGKRPGETVEVNFKRGGRERSMLVKLGSWPASKEFPPPANAHCSGAPVSSLPELPLPFSDRKAG
jgi:membrane-associated protease RseP (regulator of RpoE activity)